MFLSNALVDSRPCTGMPRVGYIIDVNKSLGRQSPGPFPMAYSE